MAEAQAVLNEIATRLASLNVELAILKVENQELQKALAALTPSEVEADTPHE